MVNYASRTRIHLLMAMGMALALVVLLGAPLAFAARSLCRTDPVVTLSDGRVVTLYADIETDLSNVVGVDYVLHLPRGLSVVSVEHPIAATAGLENFTYDNDEEYRRFSAETTVRLKNGKSAEVTAFMDVKELPSQSSLRSDKRGGWNGERLQTRIKVSY